MAVHRIDLTSLDLFTREKLLSGLGVVFYVAMGAALLSVVVASPGWAFLLLVLGSGALVARTALEVVDRGRGSAD